MSVLGSVYDDLRERDLDACLVEENLDLAVEDTRSLVDVLFLNACAELENDAAVCKFLDSEICRFFNEKIRILCLERRDVFLDLRLYFL